MRAKRTRDDLESKPLPEEVFAQHVAARCPAGFIVLPL